MQSIEKLFAVVDRKVDAFDFVMKKVKGKQTGNEYYAISGICIINGENYAKRVLTIGCPKAAIETVANAMLAAVRAGAEVAATTVPGLRKVESTTEIPGLRKVAVDQQSETIELVDENDFDRYDDDTEEICDECGEYLSECTCDEDECEDECERCSCCDSTESASRISLTLSSDRAPASTPANETPAVAPVTLTVSATGPKTCPYCSAKVAPNFAFCPSCGGQQ